MDSLLARQNVLSVDVHLLQHLPQLQIRLLIHNRSRFGCSLSAHFIPISFTLLHQMALHHLITAYLLIHTIQDILSIHAAIHFIPEVALTYLPILIVCCLQGLHLVANLAFLLFDEGQDLI